MSVLLCILCNDGFPGYAILDLEGKTDFKIRTMEEVEEMRTKRADKQVYYHFTLFPKNYCEVSPKIIWCS